jgi:hypothetical protein
LPRVGDRVIGIKSLRIGIEQMYRPRISVPMLGIRQKIAIGGIPPCHMWTALIGKRFFSTF